MAMFPEHGTVCIGAVRKVDPELRAVRRIMKDGTQTKEGHQKYDDRYVAKDGILSRMWYPTRGVDGAKKSSESKQDVRSNCCQDGSDLIE